MIKISATILTLNEQRRLEACIESLHDIADEIIVVDSGSTDATVEIAQSHGCRVVTRPLTGFGAQRQYATSLTTYSYVLAIDADEALSPALRQSILKIKNSTPQHRVYAFRRLNFYCGYAVRHCGWYPDVQIRLFDKRYANWNLRDVHERVTFRDSVQPEILDGELLHNRCDSRDEYSLTLRSHAALRAADIAASARSISPLTPTWKGLRSFIDTYILNCGLLDGSVGFAISRHNYRAERHAFAEARQIIAKRKNL